MASELIADIVPVHLAVKAMRDNGYKNAAYAIAELMDNALQAEASVVELLVGEQEVFLDTQKRSRISQIGLLDNGHGMSADVLQMALQFGNGTHLQLNQQLGMGKFGMGLPASSISQCRRVEVWSWKDGVDSALYSYLDLHDIESGALKTVPRPAKKDVPEVWRKIGKSFGKSGTLVVWSQIDRCLWKTAKALMDNSELLIGRIYRKFLDERKATIRLVGFDIERPQSGSFIDRNAKPNDPGYLMSGTSTPSPYDETPMFKAWGGEELFETTETIRFRDQDHEIKVRFTSRRKKLAARPTPAVCPTADMLAKTLAFPSSGRVENSISTSRWSFSTTPVSAGGASSWSFRRLSMSCSASPTTSSRRATSPRWRRWTSTRCWITARRRFHRPVKSLSLMKTRRLRCSLLRT